LLAILLSVSLTACAGDKYRVVRPETYSGMADASGAVAIGPGVFAVADDEDNILRLYRSDLPGAPISQFDATEFLGVHGKYIEGDLEGAARLGDRVYWIGSHGRNKHGKERPNRGCFFATDIKGVGDDTKLVPVGRPYHELLTDFQNEPRLERFRLAEAANRGPKEPGGLNVEGLSATPGGHLLIGFRNPIRGGKILLIPLSNPDEVITGGRARLGEPIEIDLDGLGIRDMAFFDGTYIIIGGSYRGGGKSELFCWDGATSKPERLKVKHFSEYNPEAIIIYPDKGLRKIQILSDDGTGPVEGVPGKEVKDPTRKSFRSFWVELKNDD
jgi:hypothetical protein